MKILIADNAEIVCKRLMFLLSNIEEDIEIIQATNASEALLFVRELKPDVMIWDIKPNEENILILRRIKAMGAAPIIIVFTDLSYSQYQKKCAEVGADFFFRKSKDIKKMIGVLEKLNKNVDADRMKNAKFPDCKNLEFIESYSQKSF